MKRHIATSHFYIQPQEFQEGITVFKENCHLGSAVVNSKAEQNGPGWDAQTNKSKN